MASPASVQECEEYIEQNEVQTILKECIAKICNERPANVYKWMREYFEKLEKVSETRFFAGSPGTLAVTLRVR